MFDWWLDLPAWLRITVALVVLAAGAGVCYLVYANGGGGRRGYTLGFALIGLGLGMVMFGGKTEAEKKGYRF